MAQAKVNVTVQQSVAIAPVRVLLQQEVTVNRLALNLKRRKERLKQELGG